METRKLQQVGGGTYTVSIPKDWAVEQGLEAGSEVHLFAHDDGSIVVRSSENDVKSLNDFQISIEGDQANHVARTLHAAHIVGFQRVTFRCESEFNDEQRRAANAAKRRFVGLELVAEGDQEITYQNLLNAPDVSVRQSVVQLQFAALAVHRQAAGAFVDGEPIDRDRLRERSEEADRLFQMIARHFSRSLISMAEVDHLGIGRPNLFDYYATAEALARITERGVSVACAADEVSSSLLEVMTDNFERASDISRRVLEESTAAVLEGTDVDTVCEFLDSCDEAMDAIEAIHNVAFSDAAHGLDASPTDVRALTRALDALTRTVEHESRIAEIALRAGMRDEGHSTSGHRMESSKSTG